MIRRYDMTASKNKDNKDRLPVSGETSTGSGNEKKEIFDTLTDMLSELLDMPKKEFSLDTMLFEDLPLDSLQLYELVVDLETKYDLHISDEAIEMIRSIGDVVNMIYDAKH